MIAPENLLEASVLFTALWIVVLNIQRALLVSAHSSGREQNRHL